MQVRQRKKYCAALVLLLVSACVLPSGAAAGSRKDLRLNVSEKALRVGKTFQLKVKTKTANSKRIRWTSSKKSVATVSSGGKVRAKKTGKARITAKMAGTSRKAVCVVTVKGKAAPGSPQPSAAQTPPASEAPSETPAAVPSTAATAVPGTAAEAPGTTSEPSALPVSSPADSPQPSETQAPPASAVPTVTPAPVDPSVLVVSTQLVTVDDTLMTAYLINKNFYGEIHICLNQKEYSGTYSGRSLLSALVRGAATKENQAGTIRVSRESMEEEYWTIKDLEMGKTYYMKAATENTWDPGVADCGVIYIVGDVRSEVELYGQSEA